MVRAPIRRFQTCVDITHKNTTTRKAWPVKHCRTPGSGAGRATRRPPQNTVTQPPPVDTHYRSRQRRVENAFEPLHASKRARSLSVLKTWRGAKQDSHKLVTNQEQHDAGRPSRGTTPARPMSNEKLPRYPENKGFVPPLPANQVPLLPESNFFFLTQRSPRNAHFVKGWPRMQKDKHAAARRESSGESCSLKNPGERKKRREGDASLPIL